MIRLFLKEKNFEATVDIIFIIVKEKLRKQYLNVLIFAGMNNSEGIQIKLSFVTLL